MNKELLVEYVKKAIRQKLKEQEAIAANREKSIYLIYKFPGLKDVLVNILSPAFPRFIQEVRILSPKPTTFQLTLTNGMTFIIYYANKNKFIVKVSGKKYQMDSLGDIERASQAITDLLELSYNEETLTGEKSKGMDGGAGGGATGGPSFGGGGGGSMPGGGGASPDTGERNPEDLKAALDGAEHIDNTADKSGGDTQSDTGDSGEEPEEPEKNPKV